MTQRKPTSADADLSAYLDGELSPAEAAAFQQELAGSAELRMALESLRRVSTGLRALPQETSPPELSQELLAAFGEHARRPRGPAIRPLKWIRYSGLAATLALFATGGWWLGRMQGLSRVGTEQSRRYDIATSPPLGSPVAQQVGGLHDVNERQRAAAPPTEAAPTGTVSARDSLKKERESPRMAAATAPTRQSLDQLDDAAASVDSPCQDAGNRLEIVLQPADRGQFVAALMAANLAHLQAGGGARESVDESHRVETEGAASDATSFRVHSSGDYTFEFTAAPATLTSLLEQLETTSVGSLEVALHAQHSASAVLRQFGGAAGWPAEDDESAAVAQATEPEESNRTLSPILAMRPSPMSNRNGGYAAPANGAAPSPGAADRDGSPSPATSRMRADQPDSLPANGPQRSRRPQHPPDEVAEERAFVEAVKEMQRGAARLDADEVRKSQAALAPQSADARHAGEGAPPPAAGDTAASAPGVGNTHSAWGDPVPAESRAEPAPAASHAFAAQPEIDAARERSRITADFMRRMLQSQPWIPIESGRPVTGPEGSETLRVCIRIRPPSSPDPASRPASSPAHSR